MKEWWQSKNSKTRRNKNNSNSLLDFFLDGLSWFPELFLFPFRLIFWMFRGVGRFIADVF
ncbi:hypothetical protein [Lysinibacillus sp. ZYM-1]|uniref:hypothetical protein n=1 Tax=Lysinibacillus sp. ZYM-1 TaxID=1681184 RepID=UPI0006CE6FF1|nr:hypothetical protein [Lysinibacillus sp. ZYM-1]KPN96723.1 hypothetical protein AO843_00045 [Lysinibacillus sp. ZYM-1]